MDRQRCGAAGCGRYVAASATRCGRHGGGPAAGQGEGAGRDRPETSRGKAEAFRRRLAAGDYRALYAPGVGAALAQAAAGRDLDDEIGALRVALARLLAEEDDPGKLAAGVARVASVAIQAARARRLLGGEGEEGLAAALAQVLAEINEATE